MMEMFLGGAIILAWFAIVIWGITRLIIQAKQTKDWSKVGLAALSAATVAGPLLFTAPERVFFGIHTIGLGAVFALISGFMIFALSSHSDLWK